MAFLFFAYFAVVSIVAGILTVALKNPVKCGLALLVLLLHVSGLSFMLNAEFLWAVQVIVYAGAILVLHLFVLMLLNLKTDSLFVIDVSNRDGLITFPSFHVVLTVLAAASIGQVHRAIWEDGRAVHRTSVAPDFYLTYQPGTAPASCEHAGTTTVLADVRVA